MKWPSFSSNLVDEKDEIDNKIIAIQTTRLSAEFSAVKTSVEKSSNDTSSEHGSPFAHFNLGLHVNDLPDQVTKNRDTLKQFLNQQVSAPTNQDAKKAKLSVSDTVHKADIKIQWLEQVHGNNVVTVTTVDEEAIVADASITRLPNVALAIMTADCLPILLTNKQGTEVAAIHGGWRPLAANIIEETLSEMNSCASDIIAWLGPSIGSSAFEVDTEVRQAFIELNNEFSNAFIQKSTAHQQAKYLADLHKIARMQLTNLGVTAISELAECTYLQTDKYYSYRKDNITGRMASIICLR
ncbi:peptidoglycan editing factor PgeF [Colwellia echini]|uniref:peptidoglycan editing factor PgeF n=1 Tax=Colwellia echini TaxID=1982103 RepID=UPI001FECE841|nr:peptidoglycan editing factor PgeF [Colwellia echini]